MGAPSFVAWRIAQWLYASMLIAVLTMAMLAAYGCAAVPEKPLVTSVRTERVEIPVRVPCVTEAQIPPMIGTVLKTGMDDTQKAQGLDIDLREMQDLAVRYEALLRGCVKSTQPEVKK